jgi:DNA polymerase-3 subunit beta
MAKKRPEGPMRIEVDSDELRQGMALVRKIAKQTSSMKILTNVLIKTMGDDAVELFATDTYMRGRTPMAAVVGCPGGVTLPANVLWKIVSNLSPGRVVIEADNNCWALVKQGRTRYKIAGMPADEFPDLTKEPADETYVDLDAGAVLGLVERTAFAVHEDEGKAHINSVLIMAKGGALSMVATDGHRLSLSEVDGAVGSDVEFSHLIPSRGVAELKRLLSTSGVERVEFAVVAPNAHFRIPGPVGVGGWTMFSVRIPGPEIRFPPHEKVIPTAFCQEVSVDREALLGAIRRASLVGARSVALLLVFSGDGALSVESDSPDVGNAVAELDVTQNSEAVSVGLNGAFLTEAVMASSGDKVSICLNGPNDGVAIKGDRAGDVGVVMPMRL